MSIGKAEIATDFEGHVFLNKKEMFKYWFTIDYDDYYNGKQFYNDSMKKYNSMEIALHLNIVPNKYKLIKNLKYINKYLKDKILIYKFILIDNNFYAICKDMNNIKCILHIDIINKMLKESRIQKVHEYWDTHEFNGFAILCPCGCGNYFATFREMCEYHNRSIQAFNSFRNRGYTMKEALIGPEKILCPCGCGNYFDNQKDMCKYHNRSYGGYLRMIKNGATIEEALIGRKKISCPCGCGRYFSSETKMCEYYNICTTTYFRMRNKNYSAEICLGIIPNLKIRNSHILHTYLTNTLYLEKVFEKDNKIYCECKDNGEDVVLSKEVVENICREYNLNKIREKHKLIPISEEKMIYE